jgi:hypothetical protein
MTVLEPRMDELDWATAPMAKRADVTSLFARFIVRSILDGFRIWQMRGEQRDMPCTLNPKIKNKRSDWKQKP